MYARDPKFTNIGFFWFAPVFIAMNSDRTVESPVDYFSPRGVIGHVLIVPALLLDQIVQLFSGSTVFFIGPRIQARAEV